MTNRQDEQCLGCGAKPFREGGFACGSSDKYCAYDRTNFDEEVLCKIPERTVIINVAPGVTAEHFIKSRSPITR